MSILRSLNSIEPTVAAYVFLVYVLFLVLLIILACRIRPITKRDQLVPVLLAFFPQILMLRNTDYEKDWVLFLGKLIAAATGVIVALTIACRKNTDDREGQDSSYSDS